jgi:hypothetical protein
MSHREFEDTTDRGLGGKRQFPVANPQSGWDHSSTPLDTQEATIKGMLVISTLIRRGSGPSVIDIYDGSSQH